MPCRQGSAISLWPVAHSALGRKDDGPRLAELGLPDRRPEGGEQAWSASVARHPPQKTSPARRSSPALSWRPTQHRPGWAGVPARTSPPTTLPQKSDCQWKAHLLVGRRITSVIRAAADSFVIVRHSVEVEVSQWTPLSRCWLSREGWMAGILRITQLGQIGGTGSRAVVPSPLASAVGVMIRVTCWPHRFT